MNLRLLSLLTFVGSAFASASHEGAVETQDVSPPKASVEVVGNAYGIRRTEEATPPLSFDPETTALVFTDLQNDFLSPDGVTWGVVGDSVMEVCILYEVQVTSLD